MKRTLDQDDTAFNWIRFYLALPIFGIALFLGGPILFRMVINACDESLKSHNNEVTTEPDQG